MEVLRQRNVATRITFPIIDADGDTVTAAATLDSESTNWSDGVDPGAFVDLTDEAVEIGTTGIYQVSLTAAEMNFDYVYVQVKTSTAGAKTQHILINTRFAPIVDASGQVTVGAMAANSLTATAIAADAITAAKIANGAIDAATFAAGAIDAAAIATDAIGAAEFSQAAADKVWSSATRTLTAFSTALAVSVWDVLETAILTASSIGLKVKNNLDAAITTRATPAQVKTEVVNALNVDTYAEPPQQVPPATTTLVTKIGYLYKLMRNRLTQTSTLFAVYNDDAVTIDHKATVSDDGTTYDKGELGTGP